MNYVFTNEQVGSIFSHINIFNFPSKALFKFIFYQVCSKCWLPLIPQIEHQILIGMIVCLDFFIILFCSVEFSLWNRFNIETTHVYKCHDIVLCTHPFFLMCIAHDTGQRTGTTLVKLL